MDIRTNIKTNLKLDFFVIEFCGKKIEIRSFVPGPGLRSASLLSGKLFFNPFRYYIVIQIDVCETKLLRINVSLQPDTYTTGTKLKALKLKKGVLRDFFNESNPPRPLTNSQKLVC